MLKLEILEEEAFSFPHYSIIIQKYSISIIWQSLLSQSKLTGTHVTCQSGFTFFLETLWWNRTLNRTSHKAGSSNYWRCFLTQQWLHEVTELCGFYSFHSHWHIIYKQSTMLDIQVALYRSVIEVDRLSGGPIIDADIWKSDLYFHKPPNKCHVLVGV